MNRETLEDISQKLIKIIQTRDEKRVRYWSGVLENQRDPMVTVSVFILVCRHLQNFDIELNRWFQDVYFENYQPDIKRMWLDFAELCSLSL
jgi:hypothetical protein